MSICVCLCCSDGLVKAVGGTKEIDEQFKSSSFEKILDASALCVIPSVQHPHTHTHTRILSYTHTRELPSRPPHATHDIYTHTHTHTHTHTPFLSMRDSVCVCLCVFSYL